MTNDEYGRFMAEMELRRMAQSVTVSRNVAAVAKQERLDRIVTARAACELTHGCLPGRRCLGACVYCPY
jgi:hypothetical protein